MRGARTRLTPKEFELLQLLVANKGRPLRHRTSSRPFGGRFLRRKAIPSCVYQSAPKENRAKFPPTFVYLHRSVGRVQVRTGPVVRLLERRLVEQHPGSSKTPDGPRRDPIKRGLKVLARTCDRRACYVGPLRATTHCMSRVNIRSSR